MKEIYSGIGKRKLYLLVLLGWVALSTSSCTFTYYTPDAGTFSGTTTYCQGAMATPNTFNYSECSSGTGFASSGVACSVQWYYNTTGGTSIITSTPLGVATGFTSSATGAGTLNYTPRTTTPGTFYYFAYITWGSGYCASPFTSGTQTITINPPPGPVTGPSLVCAGSTVSLSVPITGGTWASSATSVATVTGSGVVGGVSPGSTVISYTAIGCGTPATATVNVLSPPAAISGPASVCVGATITLTDVTTSGTWSSSATSIASVNLSSGVVAGISQGTTEITYTSPAACTTTTIIEVNGPPGLITGPGFVCKGSSVSLTDPGTGGSWSSSNTSIATVTGSSGIVGGASPGTSVITYANGCGPATLTVMTVNSLPAVINGTTSVCIGATSVLSDSTLGGTWSSTATPLATVGPLSGVVSGVASGVATISYTMSNSCASTVLVTVIPPLAPVTGPPTVCQGLTTSLGGLPLGGTWTSSNTAIATITPGGGVVSGIAMGTTLITYTAGSGCSAIRTETVNPLAPIVGRDSVCLGLVTFLTDIVGGGTWSSSTPTVASVRIDSGKVSGLAPGTTTITYLLPTGCTMSANVKVISFPNPITGVTQACPGTTTTLANLTAGGVWSSSVTSIATVGPSNGVVTGVSPDNLNINYTILPGCTVGIQVTINPLPAPIFGGNFICPHTADSLRDTTPGGLWATTTPSLATVNDTSGILTALVGGDAIIEYTLPTGCLRTKTFSVNPEPVPVVTFNPNTITLYTPDIYQSYQWYDSIQGLIRGATSPSIAALYNEYYYVVVTDSLGCKGASALYYFNPGLLGVNTVAGNTVKIYPNPTSAVLFIESQIRVRAVVTGIDSKIELEQPDAKEIDISRLADAMYFIILYDDENNVVSKQKFVKE